MESQNLKTHFRKVFKINLVKLSQKPNYYALDFKAQKYLRQLLNFLLSKHSQKRPINLLFYFPLSIECNITKILRYYQRQKKIRIFLPFMQDISFKMVKYRLPMQKQTFGIYGPMDSKLKITTLDYAIVPAIGIDKTFRRIGFGKGMYDRFFSTFKKQPKIIFICRAHNFVNCDITESHDLQATFFITPKTFLHFKEKYYDNLGLYRVNSLRNHRWRR